MTDLVISYEGDYLTVGPINNAKKIADYKNKANCDELNKWICEL